MKEIDIKQVRKYERRKQRKEEKMINLTELIEYDLAKLLNNKIWSDKKYAYAAEDVEVSWGDFLTTKKYKEGELITVEYGDDVHGKYIMP